MLSSPDGHRWRVALPKQVASQPLALLVDDAPDVLTTTGRFLESAGFDVVRATDGRAALIELASGQEFVLLVTDYAMPVLNGVELTERVRQSLLEIVRDDADAWFAAKSLAQFLQHRC